MAVAVQLAVCDCACRYDGDGECSNERRKQSHESTHLYPPFRLRSMRIRYSVLFPS